jgi:hypothetical protein
MFHLGGKDVLTWSLDSVNNPVAIWQDVAKTVWG